MPSGDEDAAVAILSVHSTVMEREDSRRLEEMIYDTVTEALSAAGLTPGDIDSVVLSGNDEIDGRVISIMPSAGPAMGVDRDTTMIASSADHALAYAYLRALAGQSTRMLVVGWAKPSESVDPDRAELMAAEPYILRAVGMNHTISAALQASRWCARGLDSSAADGTPVAFPLTRSDLPARGDSVHAFVLATEGSFPAGSELGWIVDAGWATSSYELGGRDIAVLDSLRRAVDQITSRHPDARTEAWDVVEIAADSEFAVRAVQREFGLEADAVNPSGALSEVRTSPHVAGLGRMAAAVRSLGGGSGEQRYAAAIGFHGFASQGATVLVFSTHKEVAA
jgi:hypothetical protein